MTDSRRAEKALNHVPEATRLRELDQMRTSDVPLVEFVVAGGLRGFTPAQMFQGDAA